MALEAPGGPEKGQSDLKALDKSLKNDNSKTFKTMKSSKLIAENLEQEKSDLEEKNFAIKSMLEMRDSSYSFLTNCEYFKTDCLSLSTNFNYF